MRVSELGEKKLVEIAQDFFSDNLSGENIAVGIGDDTAAVEFGDDLFLLSSDICYADTHFPPRSPPRLCGWYAAAVNLSDLASKGGRPLGMLFDIGVPHDFPLSWFREVLRGFNECCKHYGTPVIGGDTKFSSRLLMAPTVIGRVKRSGFIPRKGCRPGDMVCITGTLGGSYGAYAKIMDYLSAHEGTDNNPSPKYNCVDEGTKEYGSADEGTQEYNCVDEGSKEYRYYNKMLGIHPHMEAGRILSKSGVVTCGMDISDGLAMSLHELARINKCGFEISGEALLGRSPPDKLEMPAETDVEGAGETCFTGMDWAPSGMSSPMDPLLKETGFSPGRSLEAGLYHGGDFGLLFTVEREKIGTIEKLFHERSDLPSLFSIGRVTGEKVSLRTGSDVKPLANRGWEHLSG